MQVLFFAVLMVWFVSFVMQFVGVAMKKPAVGKAARILFSAGLGGLTVFMVWRGIVAGRVPLSNQFEFASGFAWAAAVLGMGLYFRLRQEGILTAAMPAAFLVLSYAAFQPMEIRELMPALRSAWFVLHIGSAIFSYAAFAVAGGLGVNYLVQLRKGQKEGEARLRQLDDLGYRMVCMGFLLLTVVIFSGAIWAEQAWSAWWSWDPKETWALITWIFYAIYLHQRLRRGWQGKRMAWMAIIAVILVLFTFAGVNLLRPGLHSYAT